nr:integrase, catalytic region, zinc finger, CCHC-type, peptidase aspartic, catalytic [Tanacetum cinerariifolium]
VNTTSLGLMTLKSKALKERAKVSRPIKAFTVYPPNTPEMLVPRVLPTTSQVKIHIFTLIQQFSEFDKTCKKRITPSAITDGERGFEQTKACYLQEVIPFFQTIKDNFEEVFSVATKSELNVARFAEMHVANTSVEARCLALEAELATLRDKRQYWKSPPTSDKETPDFESVFVNGKMQASLLGKDNAIRQLKKQLFELQATCRDTESENVTLKTSVSKAKVQPSVLTRTKHAVYVELIVPRLRNNRDAHLDYLRHLKESVKIIRDIIEEAKVVRPLDRSIVSACRYTQHSQELLEYAIGTCPQGSQQRAKQLAHTPLIRKKQDTVTKPSNRQDSNKNKHVVIQKTQKTNVHVPHSTGVKRCPKAGRSQPKSNHKTNRISPAKGDNKLPVEDLPRTNKSHLRITNRVDSNSRLKRTVINSNLDSIC